MHNIAPRREISFRSLQPRPRDVYRALRARKFPVIIITFDEPHSWVKTEITFVSDRISPSTIFFIRFLKLRFNTRHISSIIVYLHFEEAG